MSPQDSFIDEDEDSCPLCVEEFDLSDKNFRPCPCGYQICQFCFNNIKNNINGLCPACRRPYDEKTIEWKVVTPEEIAQFKANVQKNAKKKQEQRQREAQKREVESQNRKHLSGLRVVQKNLVYVVGISPGIPEQEILSTLRGEKYFGQYGKIVKIVVSNKKQGDSSSNNQSLGVYVTFARKEDAARCIAAVNGSQNGDRILRAQLGTTKYCSAYLRNEICTNKNCMFLHEPGDNDDSYSRQDLSSINSVNQQRPLSSLVSGATSSKQSIPTHTGLSTSLPTQAMIREGSKEGSENGDGSALPSSASWANRGLPQRSRRSSHSTIGAAPSPAISQALPVTKETEEPEEQNNQSKPEATGSGLSDIAIDEKARSLQDNFFLNNLIKAINSTSLSFPPPKSSTEVDKHLYPPLFDDRGGEKRRAMREQQENASINFGKNFQEVQPVPELIEEEELESGSLQLGGEPEDRDIGREGVVSPILHNSRQSSSQLPTQRVANNGPFGPRLGQTYPKTLGGSNPLNGRNLNPLQQQQLLMKTSQQSDFTDQYPPGISISLNQNNTIFQQGHGRQASRYNFSNENSTSIKTSSNSKLAPQQSSMMPAGNHTQQAAFYPPIQGPPPGLKSSGTPPTNGSMFTQNIGFGNSMSGNLLGGLQKENNSDMLRDMIRGRGTVSGSQTYDAGKHDQLLPSFDDARSSVDALVGDITAEEYGQTFATSSRVSRCSTPFFPPGFGLPGSHIPEEQREDPIPWSSGRVIPTLVPFTPQKNLSSIGRSLAQLHPFSSSSRTSIARSSGLSSIQQSKETKSQTGSLKLNKAKPVKSPLQYEDFPVLEAGKGKPISPSTNKTAAQGSFTISKQQIPTVASQVSQTSSETQPSQNVNTSIPIKNNPKRSVPTEPSKQAVAFPRLPINTTPSIHSQTPRNVPKTLRLTSAPKPDISANSSVTSSTVNSILPAQLSASRQPSLVSNIRLESPGTPTSEIISDNASITSTSFSRASSPPPTRVGSAPMRTTTKSSQKKHRQAQKEKDMAGIEASVTVDAEVEIGPIMGRKKKQKKDRTHNMTGIAIPLSNRPQTPGNLTESAKECPTVEEKTGPEVMKSNSGSDISQPVVKAPNSSSNSNEKDKIPTSSIPDPAYVPTDMEEEYVAKPPPTPAAIFQSFLSTGVIKDVNELHLLKNISSSYRHTDILDKLTKKEVSPKLTITPEDHETLQAGKPVHKISEGGHRILLTPNGDCVRNLTEEEENSYLDYQARLVKDAGPTTFVSSKHSGQNGFTMIGGRAVPSGPPSFFPTPNKGNNFDAVSKIQRDEALNYINQYVLPTLSNNSQFDKTFNANTPHGDLMRSGPVDAAWKSWGPERALISSGNTDFCTNHFPNGEGMIENITTHFAIGEMDRQANCSLLSLSDAESAMQIARKEADSLEKRLNALIKKNRRLLLGSGH